MATNELGLHGQECSTSSTATLAFLTRAVWGASSVLRRFCARRPQSHVHDVCR